MYGTVVRNDETNFIHKTAAMCESVSKASDGFQQIQKYIVLQPFMTNACSSAPHLAELETWTQQRSQLVQGVFTS